MSEERSLITTIQQNNFLENLSRILEERWMGKTELVSLVRYKTGRSFKMTGKYSLDNVNLIEKVLNVPLGQLLTPPKPSVLSVESKELIAALRKANVNKKFKGGYYRKGQPLIGRAQWLSGLTGLEESTLKAIINDRKGRFSQQVIEKLVLKGGVRILPLIPFAKKSVDFGELAQKVIPKRPPLPNVVISQLMREFGVKFEDLKALNSRWSHRNFYTAKYLSNESSALKGDGLFWQRELLKDLEKLGAKIPSEKDLQLMGRFKLSTKQLADMREAKKILWGHLKQYGPTKITQEQIYTFYVELKHLIHHTADKITPEKIGNLAKKIGFKTLMSLTAFAVACATTVPAVAAEIAAENGIEFLTERASYTSDKTEAFCELLLAHCLKFLLLVPKGIEAAIATPFPQRGTILSSIFHLPMDVVGRFVEADGLAKSIVDDWVKVGGEVQRHFSESSWKARESFTEERISGDFLLSESDFAELSSLSSDSGLADLPSGPGFADSEDDFSEDDFSEDAECGTSELEEIGRQIDEEYRQLEEEHRRLEEKLEKTFIGIENDRDKDQRLLTVSATASASVASVQSRVVPGLPRNATTTGQSSVRSLSALSSLFSPPSAVVREAPSFQKSSKVTALRSPSFFETAPVKPPSEKRRHQCIAGFRDGVLTVCVHPKYPG